MSDSSAAKLSADLRISKRFKYTPIFKNSFIKQKERSPRNGCTACFETQTGRLCGYSLLAVTCVLSLVGSAYLWGTDIFQRTMNENLVLKNNTQAYDWWKNPPVYPILKMYIFNYTNKDSFLEGQEKLRVEEVGPYAYRESLEKVNVVFNKNGTLTFQEKRNYEFLPEESVGAETDVVAVPNMPLISAISTMRDQFYLLRLSLLTLLNTIKAQPFTKVSVKELLWGYNDPLFTIGRTLLALKEEVPYERFGLLITRNGTSKNRVTVNTGALDISQIGMISLYNGEDRIDFWGSDECNRIDGSEGGIFPPHLVRTHSTLHLYNRDMCRRFPLVFKEHSKVFDDIPALRFHQPRNVFAHPSENPDNACFCHPDNDVCPPSGVFNVSPCAYNAPAMVSFPHFYLGDPVLLEAVDGLKPDPEKHDMYVDMHPKLGVPLAGQSRFQFNIMVRKAAGIQHLDAFQDGVILPIGWLELGLDELPDQIRELLFHATYSARAFQLVFLYGLPIVALVTGCLLYVYMRRRARASHRMITANMSLPPTEVIAS